MIRGSGLLSLCGSAVDVEGTSYRFREPDSQFRHRLGIAVRIKYVEFVEDCIVDSEVD